MYVHAQQVDGWEADQTRLLTEEFLNSRQALLGYVAGLMRSTKDAEDIVQDSYIRIVQAKHYKAVDYPRAYIFRIVRNVAIDHMRRSKRADKAMMLVEVDLADTESFATPENWLLAEESVNHQLEAIAALPPKCRNVYAMRKFHGLSHKEIADRLGLSVRTVENHIAKASRRCQNSAPSNNCAVAPIHALIES